MIHARIGISHDHASRAPAAASRPPVHRPRPHGARERADAPPLRLLLEPHRARRGGVRAGLGRHLRARQLLVPAHPRRGPRRWWSPSSASSATTARIGRCSTPRRGTSGRHGSSRASSPASATAGGRTSTTGTTSRPTRRTVTPTSVRARSRSRRDIAARRSTGFPGWFMRRQGWLFFPLLTLEGINLHVASVRTLFGPDAGGAPTRRGGAGRHPPRGLRRRAAGAAARSARRPRSSASRWRCSGCASAGRSRRTTRACRSSRRR